MWHAGVESTRPDHAVIDPIINDLIAGAKSFGHLADSQFLRPLEFRRWNPIAATDPLDDFHRIRLTLGAELSLAIEPIGDLDIGQAAGEFSDSACRTQEA